MNSTRQKKIIFFLSASLLLVIFFSSGCSKKYYVKVNDFQAYRETIPTSLSPNLKSNSPEQCATMVYTYLENCGFDRRGEAVRDSYFNCSEHRDLFQLHRNYRGMEDGRKYANYFLKKVEEGDLDWSNHQYRSKIAYQAALLSFLMLRDIESDEIPLYAWDRNVINLLKTMYYVDKARQYDETANGMWTQIAEKVHYLLRHSFNNVRALDMLVEARIYMRFAPKYLERSCPFIKKSLCILREIRTTYPTWIPEIIEGYIKAAEDKLERINCN